MCGLVAAISKKGKPAAHRVFELYRNQHLRGMAGYGYLAIHNGKLVNEVRALTEAEIKPKLLKEKASVILFHHRKPTSTNNTLRTTHPMFVSHESLDYDYFIMHNGVITNASFRKQNHKNLGFQYLTEHTLRTVAEYPDGEIEPVAVIGDKFNDSESLAIDLARYIETDDTRVHSVGAAAFMGIQLEKGTDNVHSIFFGHNYGRDLKWSKSKNWATIASETGDMIEHMQLYTMNLQDNIVEGRGLRMDEARPVNTNFNRNTATPYNQESMGFNTNRDANYRLPQPQDYAQQPLENKFYTFMEMTDTNRGSNAFDIVFLNHKKKQQMYYVPKVFNQEGYEQERYEKLEEELISEVEDLALEFVELEEKEMNHEATTEEEYRLYEVEAELKKVSLPKDIVENIITQARDVITWSNEKVIE